MKKIIITESQLFKIQEILNLPQSQYIEDEFGIPIDNSDREFNVTIEAIYIEEDNSIGEYEFQGERGLDKGRIAKIITGFRPKKDTFNPAFTEIIEKWINNNWSKLEKHFYNIIDNMPINESKKKIIITENQLKTIINSTKK